jgi:hypothetical protein
MQAWSEVQAARALDEKIVESNSIGYGIQLI